jgi:hypothetical protein
MEDVMRPSNVDFIRQQGFTTEGCQDGLYSALMLQPRVIAGVVISGVVLQSPWLFLALATVLWWSALVPSHNPFDAFFNHVMADPMRLAAMPAAPPPRRFSQAVAATLAMSIAMTLFTGASQAAWLLEGVFVAASMSVVVRRFCLPAYVYHLLWSGTPATPCPSRSGRV